MPFYIEVKYTSLLLTSLFKIHIRDINTDNVRIQTRSAMIKNIKDNLKTHPPQHITILPAVKEVYNIPLNNYILIICWYIK